MERFPELLTALGLYLLDLERQFRQHTADQLDRGLLVVTRVSAAPERGRSRRLRCPGSNFSFAPCTLVLYELHVDPQCHDQAVASRNASPLSECACSAAKRGAVSVRPSL